jgi:hypothetical protein
MSQQMLLPHSLLGALAATASLVTILKIALDRPRLASCRRWGFVPEHLDDPLRRDHLIACSRSRQTSTVGRCRPRLSGRSSRLMSRGPRIRKSAAPLSEQNELSAGITEL